MVLLAHAYYREAASCFSQAERLDPRARRWPYYHGELLSHGDPDAAIPKLRRAIDLGGGDPAPRLRLANLLLIQGQLDEAESEFRGVLEKDQDNPWAHLGLGQVANVRGRYVDSLPPLQRAVSHAATEKTARLLLGEVRQRLGDTAAAGRETQLAATLPPPRSWPDPWMEEIWQLQVGWRYQLKRADSLLGQGNLPESIGLLRRTARTYPDSAETWRRLGAALIEAGDLAAAEQALNTAIALEPDYPEVYIQIGTVLYRQNNYRMAAACFRKAAALRPEYASAHFNLGLCLNGAGDRTGAIEAFRTAVHCRPNFADAHLNLGYLVMQEGQYTAARLHLQTAVDLNPGDQRAQMLLEKLKR
jgi:tetratricopeptide (TPR) repeat protein